MLDAVDSLKAMVVRKSWRLSRALNVRVKLQSATGPVSVPLISGRGLNLVGEPDADLLQTLKKVHAYRPGAVVDVGASVGMLLRCLLEVDRDVPYVAFEPDLACCQYLDTFIRLNDLRRHTVFPFALGSDTQVLDLQFGAEADVSATLMHGFRPAGMYARTKKVLVENGDRILSLVLNATDRISLVKIDVEGAENIVLRGIAQTIDVHRPFLVLEVSPYQHFLDGKVDESYFGSVGREESAAIAKWRMLFIRELDAFLAERRYASMKIRADGTLRAVASVDPGDQTTFAELNYLAVPMEQEAGFKRTLS